MLENKKDDHLNLAYKLYDKERDSDFNRIKFIPNPLGDIGLDDVDIGTNVMGFREEAPFFINAMTGGSKRTGEINKQLALIARETGLMMASGSLSAALKDPSLEDSFRVIRQVNPRGRILANLGSEHGLDNVRRAMDIVEADAMQIHLNIVQEMVMPEGDRDFKNRLENIEEIREGLDRPLMVKEVGFGMDRKSLAKLKAIGVETVDLGGAGGTSFLKIENMRREDRAYSYLSDYGLTTAVSLLEAQDYVGQMEIVATGGIRNPLDIVKSLALGASSVGVSARILLSLLDQGVDSTIELLNSWKEEVRTIFTILGARNIEELRTREIVLEGNLLDWARSRNIDYGKLSNK